MREESFLLWERWWAVLWGVKLAFWGGSGLFCGGGSGLFCGREWSAFDGGNRAVWEWGVVCFGVENRAVWWRRKVGCFEGGKAGCFEGGSGLFGGGVRAFLGKISGLFLGQVFILGLAIGEFNLGLGKCACAMHGDAGVIGQGVKTMHGALVAQEQ